MAPFLGRRERARGSLITGISEHLGIRTTTGHESGMLRLHDSASYMSPKLPPALRRAGAIPVPIKEDSNIPIGVKAQSLAMRRV
jgi:hypothetical protein